MADTGAAKAVSIVIPVFNEERGLGRVLDAVHAAMRASQRPYEVIIVDDGSTDGTAAVAEASGARVIRHPENIGYGASLKTGIRAAAHDWIVITDGDGSYEIAAIPRLADLLSSYHMAVGARQGKVYSGSWVSEFARRMFRFLAEFVTGRRIPDVNSGLRAFRKDPAIRFFDLLSDRFSFTTSITLAFMQSGYFVKYVPTVYAERAGRSKVRYTRDTLRALQGMVQSILYYNPLKLFLIPTVLFAALGCGFLIAAIVARSMPLLVCAVFVAVGTGVIAALGLLADLLHRRFIPRQHFARKDG